jgi:anaerobic magnesium-protoporphyrin IX monomethyl ester cyclase
MRVLLVNPPSPERLGSPLLGLQYVAAALMASGVEVRVLDAAARGASPKIPDIVREAESFRPDIIGMSLFTRWVWHAYRLLDELADRGSWTLVAGGAHATVCPEETLERGFDVALRGEAEQSLVRLVAAIEGRDDIDRIPGAVFRRANGEIAYGPPSELIADLDALPPPHLAQPLFAPSWYGGDGASVVPGGILTSRGCPARCTFCANYVTGRAFRYREPREVAREVAAWHDGWDMSFFPIWDDAFTVRPRRLLDLCAEFERLDFPFGFSAITRANLVTPELLTAMRRAGAVHVNFGVESGDDAILAAIGKGIRTDQVVRALTWAKDLGLATACNFMLGFPQEDEAALERTRRFMEQIAPLTDSFSTLGVVVPFPGTPIYDDWHASQGFTNWWLREDYSHYTAPPSIEDREAFYNYYTDDTNLELDFFRYSPGMRGLIRECLRFKAEHNLKAMGLLPEPLFRPDVASPLTPGVTR